MVLGRSTEDKLSAHHRNFGAFAGRDLTVIGGGQSALETAALAREQGANVRVLARASPGWSGTAYPTKSLFARGVPPAAGADAGPCGEDGARPASAWCLKERVPGRLRLLGDQLRGRLRLVAGAPALSSSFEASAPDLYLVGLASAHGFGPAMRFLHGAGYSAHRLVSHVLARATGAPSLAPAVR